MAHRQASTSRNMCEKAQTVFQAVIVNYVKNQSFERKTLHKVM